MNPKLWEQLELKRVLSKPAALCCSQGLAESLLDPDILEKGLFFEDELETIVNRATFLARIIQDPEYRNPAFLHAEEPGFDKLTVPGAVLEPEEIAANYHLCRTLGDYEQYFELLIRIDQELPLPLPDGQVG